MTSPGFQGIADLTATTCVTTGDIPPPLVGSSTTVIGMRLFLFAGRLVSSRRMTNELYILDLKTYVWTRFMDYEKRAPKPRYFHSANQYQNKIVFFGGMGYSRASSDGLCVLDDITIFDLDTYSWVVPQISSSISSPRARYAHLASVTANKLVVIGGQDLTNSYIEEINVLDLEQCIWTSSKPFEKQCGTYRSLAVSSTSNTNLPLFANNIGQAVSPPHTSSSFSSYENGSRPSTPIGDAPPVLRRSISSQSLPSSSSLASNNSIRKPPSIGAFGANRASLRRSPSGQNLIRSRSTRRIQTSRGNSLHRLSYSSNVTENNPNPVYLYSNYNFTEVKRELQVITPPQSQDYPIIDHSANMTGAFLPPGLRFPTGAILGHHLIISGTYLTNSIKTFSIWALNLANLVWSRIDTGSCFNFGSWNRGVLCEENNTYIVLGHRDRSLVEDYNHRQTNFDHVTVVNLEAFGIYQPPPATMSTAAQELGLALMNEPNMADFEIVTLDNKKIPVNSRILSQRWPHFKMLVDKYADLAAEIQYDQDAPQEIVQETAILMFKYRALEFPETYPVTLAFLQFLYTDHLLTAQQHQPAILSQLLLLADIYNLGRLRQLATHALHASLSMVTAALIYETAALSGQTGLQIRALKVMVATKKMMHQQYQTHHQQNSIDEYSLRSSSPASSIRGYNISDGSKSSRHSLIDQDIILSGHWASNNSSPPPIAALDHTRASYYDPYAAHLTSLPFNGFSNRSRALSNTSTMSGSSSPRGFLPTIEDLNSSETFVDDGQSSTSTVINGDIRSTRSNSSLKSLRSQRSFVTPNGGYVTGGAQSQRQQDSGFGFVSKGLANLGF
ncbi:hypothetical protein G9A89_002925 [Geosiphon pyriformis]|nr:hypothetical protein G9A89_002925 [Geosiphon pyriformis]